MAKYQKDPTLESVAARRGQTLSQLLADWGVTTNEELKKRCKREGVTTSFTFVSIPNQTLKNALIDLANKNDTNTVKKAKKGKLTFDEPVASDEHVGVDPGAAADPKDPT